MANNTLRWAVSYNSCDLLTCLFTRHHACSVRHQRARGLSWQPTPCPSRKQPGRPRSAPSERLWPCAWRPRIRRCTRRHSAAAKPLQPEPAGGAARSPSYWGPRGRKQRGAQSAPRPPGNPPALLGR
eukprot:scaffold653119_cov34-Prasinocladus_malaysianus.AAC.1